MDLVRGLGVSPSFFWFLCKVTKKPPARRRAQKIKNLFIFYVTFFLQQKKVTERSAAKRGLPPFGFSPKRRAPHGIPMTAYVSKLMFATLCVGSSKKLPLNRLPSVGGEGELLYLHRAKDGVTAASLLPRYSPRGIVRTDNNVKDRAVLSLVRQHGVLSVKRDRGWR